MAPPRIRTSGRRCGIADRYAYLDLVGERGVASACVSTGSGCPTTRQRQDFAIFRRILTWRYTGLIPGIRIFAEAAFTFWVFQVVKDSQGIGKVC